MCLCLLYRHANHHRLHQHSPSLLQISTGKILQFLKKTNKKKNSSVGLEYKNTQCLSENLGHVTSNLDVRDLTCQLCIYKSSCLCKLPGIYKYKITHVMFTNPL